MKAKSVSQFELHKKIKEALSGGSYMITITTCDRKEKKLEHYVATSNFPREDILPSLEACAGNMSDEILVAQ